MTAVPSARQCRAGQRMRRPDKDRDGIPVTVRAGMARLISAPGAGLSPARGRRDRGRPGAGLVSRGLLVAVRGQERGQASSVSSGVSSGGWWPQPGMTRSARRRRRASWCPRPAPAGSSHRRSPGRASSAAGSCAAGSVRWWHPARGRSRAGVQRFGVGGEGVDVVADGVIGQWPGGLGGELPAEVTSSRPVTSWSFTAVSRLTRSAIARCSGARWRTAGGRGHAREGGLGDREPGDPARMVGGQGVADPHPGVVAATANRRWPSASISATRSAARVPVSYPS